MHERIRLALICLATRVTENNRRTGIPDDRKPWWINEDAGTVRDNDGGLIAYIDPTAVDLVEQVTQLGVA